MSSFERRGFADQLSIDTPEQVALEFPVAGLGSRFLALLLDHIIQAAAMVVLLLTLLVTHLALPASQAALGSRGKWFIALIVFALFLLFWGYHSLFEAFWHGQTPGKRAMKLRVIQDSGRQITFFEALARNLLRFIDYMPGLYLAGTITMLCNQRNKRLGDLAAGTLVIHERPDPQPLFRTPRPRPSASIAPGEAAGFNHSPRAPLSAFFPADAVTRLKQADLLVIETFLNRAVDLPLETRSELARKILRQMAARMGTDAIPDDTPERVLEDLAAQLRAAGRRR